MATVAAQLELLAGLGLVIPAGAGGRRGQLGGAAQPAAQGFQQGQVTEAVGSLPAVVRGRRGRIQRDRRLIEIRRPTVPRAPRPAFTWAPMSGCRGQLIGRNLADQGGRVRRGDLGRVKFPLALGQAELDDRPGEPGRDLLISEESGPASRSATASAAPAESSLVAGEPECGRHQQRLRFAPGLILRDVLQHLSERLDARWLDELVHGQLIHGYPRGQLPVASRGGLPGRLGGGPVLPEPSGRLPVQVPLQLGAIRAGVSGAAPPPAADGSGTSRPPEAG